jgi:hypothetical protein
MKRKYSRDSIHPQGIIRRVADRLRGREQMLARGGDDRPLLLLSYPRGKREVALTLEKAYRNTLRGLSPHVSARYERILASLPAMVVVVLRPSNVCGCLGHHHPAGTESRLTRRLASELGSPVGEIDLAYEAIRKWSPQPLSTLALNIETQYLEELHFQAAMLTVLLHELEHLACPEHSEREVRLASNDFYSLAMDDLVSADWGVRYSVSGSHHT